MAKKAVLLVDYPGFIKVETSENGDSWVTVADQVKGSQVTPIPFDMVVAKKSVEFIKKVVHFL